MRFLRRALSGVFILSLTLAIIGYAGSLVFGAVTDRMNAEPRSFPQREQVIAVNVVEVRPERIAPELEVFGEVQARNTVGIRGSVGGTVVYVSEQMIEGGTVEAGEILLRVDTTDAQADLARREAELADAFAAERDAERDLMIARDDLIAAQEQADLRTSALQRQRDLQERGIGTAPELEAAELADSTARQTVLARRKAVAQAEALIDQNVNRTTLARLNVEEARRTLEGTEIIAAFDGVLSNVDVGVGSRITANEQVATLVDPDALEVALRVSTAQYATLLDGEGRLRPLDVSIGLDVEGIDLQVAGRIVRESPTVGDGLTGRLIFAAIDAAAGFRAGDFVTVTVREPPIDGIARLPATALGPDGTILVLDAEERLEVAEVELVRRQGDDVLVRAPGLEGRSAVAARTPLLGAGIKVRPIGARADGETAATQQPAIPEMVRLDPDRRARLVAFVEGNQRMPDEAKTRLLSQLEQDEVPLETVNRLESRMGG